MTYICWTDLETTGLNPKVNGITQLAILIEKNGEVLEEREFMVKPLRATVVDPKALEVQGITLDELDTYTPVKAVHSQLILMLKTYVSPYDKYSKLVLAGHNIGFDDEFLRAMFRSLGDKYYGSWFYPARIDTLSLVGEWLLKENPMLPNYQLDTLCKHFGIELEAHKAMNDIKATRELYYKLKEVIG